MECMGGRLPFPALFTRLNPRYWHRTALFFSSKSIQGWSGLARASAFVVGQAASGAPVQARQLHGKRRRREKPAPHRGGAQECCRHGSAGGKGKRLSPARSGSSGGRIAPAAMRKKRRRSGRRPERRERLAARLGSARQNYGGGWGHVKLICYFFSLIFPLF